MSTPIKSRHRVPALPPVLASRSAELGSPPSGPPRAVVVGAPVVFVVALATSVAVWGLPIARDQLFFWLGLGLLAFSVARWRTWGRMVAEWLPFYGLLVGYDLARGAASVSYDSAHQGAQIAFDRALTGGTDPTVWLQDHLWTPVHLHAWDCAVWAVYMSHFFVVWIVAAVLWRVRHERFARYAALVVVLTLIALATYWLYPAQPPWLAAREGALAPVDRVVPLVWDHLGVPSANSLYENHSFVNAVAAMPSLHAGYPCLLLAFFWSAGWRARVPLALYTLAMGTALVYGGEHYVLDILAGWAAVGLTCGLVAAGATVLRRRRVGSVTAHAVAA